MLSKTLNEVPGISSSFSLLFTYTYIPGQWDNARGKKQDIYSKKGGLTFQSSPQHKCAVSHLSRTGLGVQRQWRTAWRLGCPLLLGQGEEKTGEFFQEELALCPPSKGRNPPPLAHILYFQRQPGFSSLLEAVAWPRAARRRGPPAGWNVWGWAVHRENACHRVQSRKHPQPFVLLAQFTSPFEMA